ncbi:hypothetical protein P4K96_22795 [Bacillus cereus]|uniref:hypothetical protein n=1 Tax=Paenibacillus melissococcoides TaxID=2912268 RepID=UPI0021C4C307|nr:hypothetical protein [Paenibacillus melissococcoides]MEB9896274.1 hypothetical protein [Bacillus cereus]CAH8721297.1 hypothetical protein HTL2_006288 [Paenibacillus melissococcoides]
MKQTLFIGNCDKTDMMFYLAKLLSFEKKVLLVEVSHYRRYEYTYPKVDEATLFHQHDNFDVLEQVSGHEQMKKVIDPKDYDFILIDIDTPDALREWPVANHYYLVTTFENPVIQRNFKLMEAFFQEKSASDLLPVNKIILEASNAVNEEYLNDMMDKLPIDWRESIVYFPDERDINRKILNQYSSKVNVKGLSGPYKSGLKLIVSQMLDVPVARIKSLWKLAERSR